MEAILLKNAADKQQIEIKPNEELQKVLTLPRGRHYIQKYDKYLTFDDKLFKEVIKNFESSELPKPFIDKGHELGESFGDIEGMEIGEEGLYTFWKLNNSGIEAIKNDKYRYISPALYTLTDTNKKVHRNVLYAVTLTNIPALMAALPNIKSQVNLQFSNILENTQEVYNMERIALQFNLNKEASEEAILEMIKKDKEKIVELSAKLEEQVELHDNAAKEVVKLETELSKLKSEELESSWETFKKEKIELGQMHASRAEFWKSQYLNDKEKTIELVNSVPAKETGLKTTSKKTNESISIELSQKMIKAGLDPKELEDVRIAKSIYGGE